MAFVRRCGLQLTLSILPTEARPIETGNLARIFISSIPSRICKITDLLPIKTRMTSRQSPIFHVGNTADDGSRKKRNVVTLPQTSSRNGELTVNFAVWNARSIKARGKAIALCDFVKEEKINMFAITETWLTNSDRDARALAIINEALPNFDFHHVPRASSSGGGVGFLVHKGFDVNIQPQVKVKSFEYMDISVSSPNTPDHQILFSFWLSIVHHTVERIIAGLRNSSKN